MVVFDTLKEARAFAKKTGCTYRKVDEGYGRVAWAVMSWGYYYMWRRQK